MAIPMMMRPLTTFFSSLALLSTLLTGSVAAADITVSAAMSLMGAFEEIGRAYEIRHPGSKVRFNFGASGDLARQIAGGAPIDAFASAAQKDMNDLAVKGLIAPATRANFTRNSLVLVTPKQGPRLAAFGDLASASVKRIAITNPKTSPAGRYAMETLSYYLVAEATKSKLIFAENVRQVMDYVARGEVDAGIVFASDAAARPRDSMIATVAAAESHETIMYPVAVTKSSPNPAAASAFIATLLSVEGQSILRRHGFASMK